jgi:hypothetical protein
MIRIKPILVPTFLLALAPFVSAQHMGPMHSPGTPFHPGHFGARPFHRGYFPVGLYGGFYDDYLSDAGYPGSPQPQVIVLQPPQPTPTAEPSPPTQALMIELQGDRYVQISGDQSSRSEMIDSPAPAKLVTRSNISPSAEPISPAVLIFRDGHREEVSAYTIAGGALYASSDFATTGSWSQKIELSALSIRETIAANNDRPHPFRIPSSPNEVIVGP